jgi:uncharacterized membrane protein YagU involved in acid resistance
MSILQVPTRQTLRKRTLRAILVGGLVAGTFDLVMAFISFGWRVPRGIASGLLGSSAFHGGIGTWLLGVVLHFTIAFGAAAVFCLVSLKLDFIRQHFVVCGLFFGIAVWLVMNLIIVPLSAFPAKGRPFTAAGMIQGLLVHMFLIGLPIAASARRFMK